MQCKFIKQNSIQCRANAMVNSDYCFSHNPATKSEKEKAVLSGGLSPKPRKTALPLEPVTIKNVNDILVLIEDTINRVRTEPITHQKANCVGYLANIALKALEVGDIEERLAILEEKTINTSNEPI